MMSDTETPITADLLDRWMPADHGVSALCTELVTIEVQPTPKGRRLLVRRSGEVVVSAALSDAAARRLAEALGR